MSPKGELKYKQVVKFSAILHNKRSNKRFIIQHPKILCLRGRISRIFIYGEYVNGIGAGHPANWLVNSKRTRQTGFHGFDQAVSGAIYFTFHSGKKSSFDCPNDASIQVFHLKISFKEKRRKEIVLTKNFSWLRSNSSLRSTNIASYLYLFWGLFVLYEVQLDNNTH